MLAERLAPPGLLRDPLSGRTKPVPPRPCPQVMGTSPPGQCRPKARVFLPGLGGGGGGGGLRWRNCPGGATRSHSPSALKGTHGSARLLDRGSNCASEEDVEVKVTQSCLTLCDPMDYNPDQNTGVGSHSLLQGIIPTQRLNQGLRHCRRILYQLSHQESLKRILLHR